MPPRVTQTTPTQHPSTNGRDRIEGILGLGSDVTTLTNELVKMVVYGPNRSGKTTFACSFPKPLALVSFEPNKTGGAMSVVSPKFAGVRLFRIRYKKLPGDGDDVFEGTANAMRLVEALKTDRNFKSVVVDSATSYQDLFLQEILGLNSLPEQVEFGEITSDQYRARSERVKEGLRPFFNLDKHVVVLAKEKDHNPPKDEKVNPKTGKKQPDMRPRALRGMQMESYVAADLGGAAAMWLNDACDFIGRMYVARETEVVRIETDVLGDKDVREEVVETGRFVHRLRCKYHPNYAAGIRTPHENCPDHIDNPTFDKIVKLIKGEQV